MESRHFETKSLPEGIRGALARCGVRTKTVMVRAADAVDISCVGGAGGRGFATILHYINRAESTVIEWGSYGGPNPFVKAVRGVDCIAGDRRDVPEHGAIIRGYQSHKGADATVYVRGDVFRELVPIEAQIAADAEGASIETLAKIDPASAVTNGDAWVLYAMSYKSGYRKEEIARLSEACNGVIGSTAHLDSLVARGFISRNKAGAMSLTASGLNMKQEAPYTVRGYSRRDESRNARLAMLTRGSTLPEASEEGAA